jgi:hypothetical protein
MVMVSITPLSNDARVLENGVGGFQIGPQATITTRSRKIESKRMYFRDMAAFASK